MSSVRLRRLAADYESMRTLFTGKGRIRVASTQGTPPERYRLEYTVRSLQQDPATREVRFRHRFEVEIVLTAAYPRMAPQCRVLTPVFHPNIAPHAICVGDHWAAGESLPCLVVRIAEMLAFQSYNTKSPLSGDAARWVEQNQQRLPLDRNDFSALLSVGEAVQRDASGGLVASGSCANCGCPPESEPMQVCSNGHVTCSRCALDCPVCGRLVCLACALATCMVCKTEVCFSCVYRCTGCQRQLCTDHPPVQGAGSESRCPACARSGTAAPSSTAPA